MIGDFLSQQTDFLLLLSGLAFACLGVISRALARTDSHLPWKWCARFGFSQALHEWRGLLTPSLEPSPVSAVVGPLLNAVSFLCLAEFARSGIASVVKRGPGLWVHLVLLALTCGSVGMGATDPDAAIRYSLGAVSTLAAAWLLWRAPVLGLPQEARGRGIAAVAMAGLGLAAVAGPPIAVPLPDAGTLAGISIQLVRAVFALAIAWALCRRYRRLRRLAFGDRAARAAGRISRVAVGGVVITLGFGLIFAQESGQAADHGQRRVILTVTRMAAAAMDADSILRLAGTEADLVSPDYGRLKRQLVAARRAFPDCRFAYLMGMHDRQVIFLADSEPESSEDYSPPGQAYEEASAELVEIFRTGEEFVEGPATDRWGKWVSGLVPIVQNRSGRVVAVLGQDVDASRWAHVIARSRRGPLLITLLVATLILVFFAVQQRSQETSTAVGDSERRYRGLVEGSPNCVVLLDPTGHFLMVNRNGAAALGWAPDTILGRAFPELWPEPTREVIEAELTRAARGEQVSFESAYLRPDGRDMTWHAALNPIADADGMVRRLVGILTDITERRRAENRLRTANRELEVTNERLERAIDRANEL
ncbi:MAG: PAS domain-containing protein, partial [Candidatus Eisenbacteria bacterium]|nr:PAS domain-containing protein [Candidatus Eisenbacteria bacterium]